MALKRISVDADCKDGLTCPSVWADEQADSEYVVVVGQVMDPSPVPLADGEVAVRLRRQIVQDAKL
jgi:hypothetical protein